MYVILGGTGHIGSALANELIRQGEEVMVIGHDPKKGKEWLEKGARYEVTDVLDSKRLRELFAQGRRLFILNPPALPSSDTVIEERKSVLSILCALEGLQPEKIVAESTYGAQPGDRLGDLGVLFQLEQALALLPVPVAVIRGVYYMSNWLLSLDAVKKDGVLPTLYPADFKLPMVAPEDIGAFAAKLILNDDIGLHFIEGPERYSPNDVAVAFSTALNKPVEVASLPEVQWFSALKKQGFSNQAAEYMAGMTRITLNDDYEVKNPQRGQTSLNDYISSQAL